MLQAYICGYFCMTVRDEGAVVSMHAVASIHTPVLYKLRNWGTAEINTPVRETYYKGNERIDEVTPKYALLSTHAGRRTFRACLNFARHCFEFFLKTFFCF